MLLIFSDTSSARLTYILQLTLEEMLGVTYELISDHDRYVSHLGPKMVYAHDPLPGGLFIEASGLLFEHTIVPRDMKVKRTEGLPVIFASQHPASALSFDPFAAAFYMVTRYEEYHSRHTDCLLYTSPSPRDRQKSRMPSSA